MAVKHAGYALGTTAPISDAQPYMAVEYVRLVKIKIEPAHGMVRELKIDMPKNAPSIDVGPAKQSLNFLFVRHFCKGCVAKRKVCTQHYDTRKIRDTSMIHRNGVRYSRALFSPRDMWISDTL